MLLSLFGFICTLYIGGAVSRWYYDKELDQIIEPDPSPLRHILEGMELLPDTAIERLIDAATWPISIYEVHKQRNTPD